MTLKLEPLEPSAHSWAAADSPTLGLADQIFHHPFAVGVLVLCHALDHIGFAVLKEAIDQAGQFVGGGYDGFGGPQTRLQAAEERAQRTMAVVQATGRQPQGHRRAVALVTTLRAAPHPLFGIVNLTMAFALPFDQA